MNTESKNEIPVSAGVAIVYGQSILLCHPTNAKWYGTYSIPKGLVDENENILDAAVRELREEVGIVLIDKQIAQLSPQNKVSYKTNTNEIYKEVYYFILKINNLTEINLNSTIIPNKTLQLDEVDWAGFVDFQEAKARMFKKQLDILKTVATVNA